MNNEIRALVAAATDATQHGRSQEAEQLWRRVLALDPGHPRALYAQGMQARQAGDPANAKALLARAAVAAPGEPAIQLGIAMVCRELGDLDGEASAIERALQLDPYCLPALLAKAAAIERDVGLRAAAPVYRNALKIAPSEPEWPAAMRTALAHGKAVVGRVGEELAAFIEQRTGAIMARLTALEVERWREAGAIVSGRSTAYHSQANRLLVPRLPAIPFFPRELFPWAHQLESQTSAIAEEMLHVHAEQQSEFRPYVAYAPGTPVNQWHELNHSQRWSSYFLWRDGVPVAAHQQACPRTAAALGAIEMADIGGLCPNAMFSALSPHTRIPPHHGETNARLVVHLPLVVPEGCHYRVGFEQRQWKVGELLFFDDSIEHEARNDSDALRVVLIFDVWNPLLSEAERDMVRSLSQLTREFHQTGTG